MTYWPIMKVIGATIATGPLTQNMNSGKYMLYKPTVLV